MHFQWWWPLFSSASGNCYDTFTENVAYEYRSLEVMDSQYLANSNVERNIERRCFHMKLIHIILLLHSGTVTWVTSLCPCDTFSTSAAREEIKKNKDFSALPLVQQMKQEIVRKKALIPAKEERAGLITDLGLMSPKWFVIRHQAGFDNHLCSL